MNRYYVTEPKSLVLSTHIVEGKTLEEALLKLYPDALRTKRRESKSFSRSFNVIHVEYDIDKGPTEKFR